MPNSVMNVVDQGGDRLVLHVGPQHPGSGHFRIIVTVDGDYIVDAKPDPGYVHRGAEKMAEYRDYIQNIPHLERPVIIDASGVTLPYVLAAEKIIAETDKTKKGKILSRSEIATTIMTPVTATEKDAKKKR